MPNLDNSELIHAFGDSWRNHKYIKKIGNRYFYTMDELRNYKTNNRAKTKETSSIQPRVARESKTKQSIGDTITSGVKKAGEKMAKESPSKVDALNSEAKHWKLTANTVANLFNKHYSRDVASAGDGKDASRAGTLKRTAETLRRMTDESDSKNRERYTKSAKNNEKMAKESPSKVDALNSEAKHWKLTANTVANLFNKHYSRDVASAQKKYEADLKAYEAVLSEAQTYREQYGNTVAGKLEKAANDVQRAYNDVVRSASDAIDIGKQFAKDQAAKVSTNVSELTTKASDSVAAGLAWVESVFAPKKKK